MGHGIGKALNPFNPKHDLEKALDPAGSTIRALTGNATTPRTVLDPGNAVWAKPAMQMDYGPQNGGFSMPSGPFINPQTNMAQGAQVPPMTSFNRAMNPGAPGPVSSIAGLGGKNQIPMPPPQVPQNPGANRMIGIQPIKGSMF